jgi:hypothetical protein
MSGQWYSARGGQRVGPFSFEDLKRMASAGLLVPADMVLEDGTQQWRSAQDVEGLFLAVPAPLPASTPPPTPQPAVVSEVPPVPYTPSTPVCIVITGLVLGVGYWLLNSMGCIPEDYHPVDRNAGKRLAEEIAAAKAVMVPAETLSQDYKASEKEADSKYKGKVVEITGVITKIQGEGGFFGGRPCLQVGGVTCEFKKEEELQSLSPGQQVTVRGKCKGANLLCYCQVR